MVVLADPMVSISGVSGRYRCGGGHDSHLVSGAAEKLMPVLWYRYVLISYRQFILF